MEGKTTIRDVALQAGVAVSTVSRALSGHPHVSDAVRTRVETIARELSYKPGFLGPSLRKGSTESIGFLISNMSNPIMADLSASAADTLSAHGYAMLVVSSQNNPQLDALYLRFLAQRQVDGLIVSSASNGSEQANGVISELGIPTVMVDRRLPPGPYSSAVQSDHATGMREAVTHLLVQGHRRIALVGGPEAFDPQRARLSGYLAAFDDAGIVPDRGLIRHGGMHESAAYVETLGLLGRATPPTAIIAAGNLILVGVLQALHERNVVVGRDLALVGCDDTSLAQLYRPSISVIARDLAMMGETSARLLIETMNQGGGTVITLPTRLIVRESSVCPPARH